MSATGQKRTKQENVLSGSWRGRPVKVSGGATEMSAKRSQMIGSAMARELKSKGPAGPVILSVFGAVWAILGLDLSGASHAMWIGPIAIGVTLIGIVVRRSRRLTAPLPEEGKRIGKLVGIWSGIEGVAIFIAVNLCTNFGRPNLIIAAVCLIVGLHFFPLARWLPVPLYYFSGALLSVLGVAGLLASSLVSPPVVAFGAALLLWISVGVHPGMTERQRNC